MWTNEDLAQLTELALKIAQDEQWYCEQCQVVKVTHDERYCTECANDICEYLAQVHGETVAIDGGLY